MKLLLDEQVPARLAREFPDTCEVHTVQQMAIHLNLRAMVLIAVRR